MSKAGVKFSEVKELLMKDDEFKSEYERLKPRYDVISITSHRDGEFSVEHIENAFDTQNIFY